DRDRRRLRIDDRRDPSERRDVGSGERSGDGERSEPRCVPATGALSANQVVIAVGNAIVTEVVGPAAAFLRNLEKSLAPSVRFEDRNGARERSEDVVVIQASEI